MSPRPSPIDFVAGLVPLSLLQRIVARDVIDVFYHSFTAMPVPHITPLFGCKSPGDLERDLLYLKTWFQCVTHDDIVVHREKGRTLPANAVTVSFDDGFAECFTVARPLLLQYGVPATFFVCKSFINNGALMYRNKVALCLSRVADATPVEKSHLIAALRARFDIAADSPAAVRTWLFGLEFADCDVIDAACACLGIDVASFLRDRRPYMTSEQIAQLHADGFAIGAHTSDHPALGKVGD